MPITRHQDDPRSVHGAGPRGCIDIDYLNVSEVSLIELCESGDYPVIGGMQHGNRVVRVAPDAVIKYGWSVTGAEARTQSYVHDHVDPSIIVVPEVYRFFVGKPSYLGNVELRNGYLVMEYVEGVTLNDLEHDLRSSLSARVTSCLRHLWQIPLPPDGQPGPIGGDEPKGHAWSVDGACAIFRSVSTMEHWLNTRLDIDERFARMGCWDWPATEEFSHIPSPLDAISDRFNLAKYPLVMCHGDVAGRNIILLPDDRLCLIDWGFAGCYPWVFELHSMLCCETNDPALLSPLIETFREARSSFAKDLKMLGRLRRVNGICSTVPEDRCFDAEAYMAAHHEDSFPSLCRPDDTSIDNLLKKAQAAVRSNPSVPAITTDDRVTTDDVNS